MFEQNGEQYKIVHKMNGIDCNMEAGITSKNVDEQPPLYAELKERLLQEAHAKKIAVGDRLLPEPELAEHYNVSRRTIRRALELLELDGSILRFPKKGTFLTHFPEPELQNNPTIGINFLFNTFSLDSANQISKGAIDCAKKFHIKLMYIDEAETKFLPNEIMGLVFIRPPSPTLPFYERIRSGNIPSVCIGRKINSKVGYIGVDNRLEAAKGVKRLLDSGCKKIGFWGNVPEPENTHAELRYLGYTDALRSVGIKLNRERILFFDKTKDQYSQVEEFLKTADVDAMFVPLSPLLFSFIFAMNKLRIHIGTDLPLVCFDDLMNIGMDGPGMTYIRMPLELMGYKSVEYLYQKILLKQKIPVLNQVLEAEILTRGIDYD